MELFLISAAFIVSGITLYMIFYSDYHCDICDIRLKQEELSNYHCRNCFKI